MSADDEKIDKFVSENVEYLKQYISERQSLLNMLNAKDPMFSREQLKRLREKEEEHKKELGELKTKGIVEIKNQLDIKTRTLSKKYFGTGHYNEYAGRLYELFMVLVNKRKSSETKKNKQKNVTTEDEEKNDDGQQQENKRNDDEGESDDEDEKEEDEDEKKNQSSAKPTVEETSTHSKNQTASSSVEHLQTAHQPTAPTAPTGGKTPARRHRTGHKNIKQTFSSTAPSIIPPQQTGATSVEESTSSAPQQTVESTAGPSSSTEVPQPTAPTGGKTPVRRHRTGHKNIKQTRGETSSSTTSSIIPPADTATSVEETTSSAPSSSTERPQPTAPTAPTGGKETPAKRHRTGYKKITHTGGETPATVEDEHSQTSHQPTAPTGGKIPATTSAEESTSSAPEQTSGKTPARRHRTGHKKIKTSSSTAPSAEATTSSAPQTSHQATSVEQKESKEESEEESKESPPVAATKPLQQTSGKPKPHPPTGDKTPASKHPQRTSGKTTPSKEKPKKSKTPPKTPKGGQQSAHQDIEDVNKIRDEFAQNPRPHWCDPEDELLYLCEFENISEEQRSNIVGDGCFLVPIEFYSIKYSAPVKSEHVNYDIQVYGEMLRKAVNPEIFMETKMLPEENQSPVGMPQKRGRGRPRKIPKLQSASTSTTENQSLVKRGPGRPRKTPKFQSASASTTKNQSLLDRPLNVPKSINYDNYPNISPHRIPLKLHDIDGLHIDDAIICLELFMNIDYNLFGQLVGFTHPGMLISFRRNGNLILKCVRISNILAGLNHNKTQQSKIIQQLQQKYDADCELQQKLSPQQLRIVPFTVNTCMGYNLNHCDNDGYVVCSKHNQCLCFACYKLFHPNSNLNNRILPVQSKECICDTNMVVSWKPQPRMNMAHFLFMRNDDQISRKCLKFHRLPSHMICPGYSCFDTKQLMSKKGSTNKNSILDRITDKIKSTFLPHKKNTNFIKCKRNWISFLGHSGPRNTGPSILFGEDISEIPLPDLITTTKTITHELSNHLGPSDELLISFISCFLNQIHHFLDIPQANNQYVMFVLSNTMDAEYYANFPNLLRKFWQDDQQSITEAFENTMRKRPHCCMTLVSYVTESRREVTKCTAVEFIYETYNRNNGKWEMDESQCTKNPMWPQTTTPSMNTQKFVSQTQTLASSQAPMTPLQIPNLPSHSSSQPNSIFQSLTNLSSSNNCSSVSSATASHTSLQSNSVAHNLKVSQTPSSSILPVQHQPTLVPQLGLSQLPQSSSQQPITSTPSTIPQPSLLSSPQSDSNSTSQPRTLLSKKIRVRPRHRIERRQMRRLLNAEEKPTAIFLKRRREHSGDEIPPQKVHIVSTLSSSLNTVSHDEHVL